MSGVFNLPTRQPPKFPSQLMDRFVGQCVLLPILKNRRNSYVAPSASYLQLYPPVTSYN